MTSPALTEVTQYIVREFAADVRPEDLADDYDLLDNGVVDSLGLLRLIGWIGERFSIPVADLDLAPDDFRTTRAIGDFVARSTAGPPERGLTS